MEQKTCSKCGKNKFLNQFVAFRSRKDKHILYRNVCKKCKKEYDLLWNLTNLTQDRIKKYNHNRVEKYQHNQDYKDRILTRNRFYRKTPKGKMGHLQSGLLYREKYPEKYIAHYSIYNKIKNRKLEKPIICSTCGNQTQLEGHHYKGYIGKNIFEVKWLCSSCHNKEHQKEKINV